MASNSVPYTGRLFTWPVLGGETLTSFNDNVSRSNLCDILFSLALTLINCTCEPTADETGQQ